MDRLAFAPASELVAALTAREVSSRELLEHYLGRVEAHPEVNAVVVLDAERARRDADAADRALARGERLGALHGLPMTVKECFEAEGLPTTCGAPELTGHVSTRDAEPVARLRRAGAVLFGKTNLPLWAADGQAFNDIYGVTSNPWDLTRGPGGSSGGAAAALAAGLTGFELGSDVAGSVRIPAHMCGVFGLAPTFGIVPTRGHVLPRPGALAPVDMNVAGPMGRGPEDLELGLDVLAGPDAAAATAWRLELPPPRPAPLRLAAWLDDPHAPVDGEVRAVLERVVADVGAPVVDSPVDLAESDAAFRVLLAGASGTARLSDAEYERQRAGGSALTKRDWDAANEVRAQLRARWAAFFERHDALLMPAVCTAAVPHDRTPLSERRIVVDGQERPAWEHVTWTGLATVARLPAASVPVGRTASGLPVGIQVVGPHLEDRTVVAVARVLAELTGGFAPPPGF
jgi:amidase